MKHLRCSLHNLWRLLEWQHFSTHFLLGACEQEFALDIERLHPFLQSSHFQLLAKHPALLRDSKQPHRGFSVHSILFSIQLAVESLLLQL